MPKLLFTGIGWMGALLCTIAYVLLTMKILSADSPPFQVLNIFGGLCLCIAASETSDMPNVIANFLWMVTGIIALGRYYRGSRSGRQ